MKNRKTFFGGALAGMLVASVAWAAVPAGGLHIFSPGEVISSAQVNENFALLDAKIQGNCTAIELLAGLDPAQVNAFIDLVNQHINKIETNETNITALQEKCVAVVSSITVLEECKDTHNTRIETLETKTQFQSVDGTTTCFSGTNVQIKNGEGTTATTNSLGNLIMGYNEDAGFAGLFGKAPERTGSHNIIVGRDSQWTSYGGICGGAFNHLDGPLSVVFSCENRVECEFATVVGGTNNTAKHKFSAVGGGNGQTTSQCQQWVAGRGGSGFGSLPVRRLLTFGVNCQCPGPPTPPGDQEPE